MFETSLIPGEDIVSFFSSRGMESLDVSYFALSRGMRVSDKRSIFERRFYDFM